MNDKVLRENIEKIVRATLLEAYGSGYPSEEELYNEFAKQVAEYVKEDSGNKKEDSKESNKESLYDELTKQQKELGSDIDFFEIDEINKKAEEGGLIDLSKYETLFPGLLDKIRNVNPNEITSDDFDLFSDEDDEDNDEINESLREGDSRTWLQGLYGDGFHVIKDKIFKVRYNDSIYAAGRPFASTSHNTFLSGIVIQWMFDDDGNPVVSKLQSYSQKNHPLITKWIEKDNGKLKRDRRYPDIPIDLEQIKDMANKILV